LQKIDIFESYKPLQNCLRQFHLIDSLNLIWQFCRELSKKGGHVFNLSSPAPFGGLRLGGDVYVWELDILVKELILNAGSVEKLSLVNHEDFYRVIKLIRDIDQNITKLQGQGKIFNMVHRCMHQQIPLQRSSDIRSIMRYYLIFKDSELNQMVEQKVGLTIQQFYLLGLAISGHFLRSPNMSTDLDYSGFGVDEDRRNIFFKLVSTDLDSLKQKIKENQKYDETWSYTFNPLQAAPLIAIDPMFPNRVICPFPSYLIKRVSEGIFYDIPNKGKFANAYGRAYESYVGMVLKRACSPPIFKIVEGEKYRVGKNNKHGLDWILKDDTGVICIECKTKRLRRDAKFDSDGESFSNDLTSMAKFIFQTYKNIEDIRAGHTKFHHEGLPIYPTIITLEEWFFSIPDIVKKLDEEVGKLLAEERIDQKILQEMPYSIISIADAEDIFQFINQVGIEPYARSNLGRERPIWPISGASVRGSENFRPKFLFEKEFNEMIRLISKSDDF
jgi:hypothetical protein